MPTEQKDVSFEAGEVAFLRFLEKTTRIPAQVHSFGPPDEGVRIAVFKGYPTESTTTYVTIGASRVRVSIFRCKDIGFEIVMTVPHEMPDVASFLAAAVLANSNIDKSRERRRFIEYNGVWAPGYPPHLVFSADITATPKFSGRHVFAGRYVQFLNAIPIDDTELRLYDRDVGALLDQLRSQGRVVEYPRSSAPA